MSPKKRTGASSLPAAALEPADEMPSWAARAVVRSVDVQRSQSRALNQTHSIINAAQRLVNEKGAMFTTQEVTKEAKIALQTLYRHFSGIDELALAVIETMVAEAVRAFEASGSHLDDPVDRLRHFVQLPLLTLEVGERASAFLATERWRLQRLFPEEMERARAPFKELVRRELEAAVEAGRADPPNGPDHDAQLVTELMTAVYYDTAVSTAPEPVEVAAERLWRFCRTALGLHPASA